MAFPIFESILFGDLDLNDRICDTTPYRAEMNGYFWILIKVNSLMSLFV